MIHFDSNLFWSFLIFVLALVLWKRFLAKRGERFVWISGLKWMHHDQKNLKTFLHNSLFWVRIASLVILIMALARPQFLNYYKIEKKQGIDILIALDISGSMASIDFQPKNRLEVAKEVITDFMGKRETDHLALVIFAGTSYTKCPLTFDYELLREILRQTKIGELEDGTAVGMALASSVNRIKNAKSLTKIIILLTDGNNNRGEIDPRDAAKMAKDMNIKVYTIGVGTRGQAPYPFTDANGNTRHIMVPVEIDEDLLKDIANSTGGIYFRATDKTSLEKIFAEIDRWEKSDVGSRQYYDAEELFPYFIGAALVLLFLAEFSRRTFLRTLP